MKLVPDAELWVVIILSVLLPLIVLLVSGLVITP
jgi:hypothetical protein